METNSVHDMLAKRLCRSGKIENMELKKTEIDPSFIHLSTTINFLQALPRRQPGLGFEGNLRIAVYTSTILDPQMTCQTLAKEMNPNSPTFLIQAGLSLHKRSMMELSKTSWCPSRFNLIVFNLDLVGFDAEGSSCL